ncbi:MAG: hypothetical protein U0235_14440 [Polyangiaceae bacterium]
MGVRPRRPSQGLPSIASSTPPRAGETLKLREAQAGCPTDAAWLAEVTRAAWSKTRSTASSTTGSELFTKAAWAYAIAEALELGPLHEEVEWAAARASAPRPVSVALRSARATRTRKATSAQLRAMRAAILASAS